MKNGTVVKHKEMGWLGTVSGVQGSQVKVYNTSEQSRYNNTLETVRREFTETLKLFEPRITDAEISRLMALAELINNPDSGSLYPSNLFEIVE